MKVLSEAAMSFEEVQSDEEVVRLIDVSLPDSRAPCNEDCIPMNVHSALFHEMWREE